MEVENTEVIKAAVSEGLGISIISLGRIQQEVKTGLLIPVKISGLSIRATIQADHAQGNKSFKPDEGLSRALTCSMASTVMGENAHHVTTRPPSLLYQ